MSRWTVTRGLIIAGLIMSIGCLEPVEDPRPLPQPDLDGSLFDARIPPTGPSTGSGYGSGSGSGSGSGASSIPDDTDEADFDELDAFIESDDAGDADGEETESGD